MEFQGSHLYHIYNQGNNRRKIFTQKKNYYFFIEKVRKYITPYADIFAWCLMPNHFHLMVKVNYEEILLKSKSRGDSKSPRDYNRSLNDSIAIMLRSYTRAINNQENWTGSLFREKTKADCLTSDSEFRKPFFNSNGITYIQITDYEKQYPQICFDYIHNNPVEAGLCNKITDYEFSSAKDYAELRNGTLISKVTAKEYINPNKIL